MPIADPSVAESRLDRRVASLLNCSRSLAQKYIEGGWVTVDGKVCEAAQQRTNSAQLVLVRADAALSEYAPATMLLNKPAGIPAEQTPALVNVSTAADPNVRMLQRHFDGLIALMSLSAEIGGLEVLSQDPRVARRLREDAATLEQEYEVEVSGQIAPYGLALLRHGLSFKDHALAPAKVSWQSERRLRFAIKHVQTGQLTAMCEQVGLSAIAARRLRVGRVSLAGLPIATWRFMQPAERF